MAGAFWEQPAWVGYVNGVAATAEAASTAATTTPTLASSEDVAIDLLTAPGVTGSNASASVAIGGDTASLSLSIPTATTASQADLLLALQLDTTVTPNVYRLRLIPVSLVAATANLAPAVLGPALTTLLQNLPDDVPDATGELWLDGNQLALS